MGNSDYKQRHREQGLCVDCPLPAMPGHIRCVEHLHSHAVRKRIARSRDPVEYRKKWRRIYIQRKKDGRCPKCGNVKEYDVDEGFIVCQNCREKISFEY